MANQEKTNKDSAMTPQESGSLGGRARARNLTPEERKANAAKAARARWGETAGLPHVSHSGPLMIADATIQSFVLSNGMRVLSSIGVTRAFGARKKSVNTPKNETGTPPPRMPAFLASEALRPHITAEFAQKMASPTLFKLQPDSAVIGHGYEATLLPEICGLILDAQRAGRINNPTVKGRNARQIHAEAVLVRNAEMLLRSFAKVGIVALVDEATGYQDVRDRQALQTILDRYLRHEFAAWAKRFPDEFYEQIFRLRGWTWRGMKVNRPQCVAEYTKDVVYRRMVPGMLKELETRNPVLSTIHRRTAAHHQFFTEDIGHPALAQHLYAVIGFMRASKDWTQFKALLDSAFPKRGDTLSFEFMKEPPTELHTED